MSQPGLMQPVALSIPHIFHRAEQQFGMKRIAAAQNGLVRHLAVLDWAARVRSLAGALTDLAVPSDAAVATFSHNTQEHLELYYAVPCTGRVLHPLNIRLSSDQLRYIIELVGDDIIFIDRDLLGRLWPIADELPSVRKWIVIDDGSTAEIPDDARVLRYEDILARAEPHVGDFEIANENQAAGICFTSGTTGNPKGVVYSHRSTVLHALVSLAAGLIGLSERDTVMPIVPMFHASAWGLPYSALFGGARLVLPGSNLEPRALLALIQDEHVTVASAVPTIWASLLPHVSDFDHRSLRVVFGGGSATPARLADEWQTVMDIPITHTWGMTELSPTGVVGGLRSWHDDADDAVREGALAAQGPAIPLVDLRIVDLDTDERQPHDGLSVGELQARGPTVAAGYFGQAESGESFTADGWLRTGDLASIDEFGYILIRDRIKDLIKSGGEWIPSQQLEAAILANPLVAEVAVVAQSDPRWSERPVAFVVAMPGSNPTQDDILEHLRSRVPRWWLPDRVEFRESLPKTGTGKIEKQSLKSAAL